MASLRHIITLKNIFVCVTNLGRYQFNCSPCILFLLCDTNVYWAMETLPQIVIIVFWNQPYVCSKILRFWYNFQRLSRFRRKINFKIAVNNENWILTSWEHFVNNFINLCILGLHFTIKNYLYTIPICITMYRRPMSEVCNFSYRLREVWEWGVTCT